jgi:hypothetical protein
LQFGANFGDLGPKVVDRRLEIMAPRTTGRCGMARGVGDIHRLGGTGIDLLNKLTQLHPLFRIKLAEFAQEIRSSFFDLFAHEFSDSATQEKGFDQGVIRGIGTAIHKKCFKSMLWIGAGLSAQL